MRNKRIFRTIKYIMLLTFITLCYVHQQVEIVKTSYAMDRHTKKLCYLLDQHRALLYNLNKLEKPSALEARLCSDKIDLTRPDKEDILGTPIAGTAEYGFGAGNGKKGVFARAMDLFGTKAEAQVR